MKVVISVAGRFHAFHLAGQLHKRGCLEKLFATDGLRSSDTVPKDKLHSNLFLKLLNLLEKALFVMSIRGCFVSWLKSELFDRMVARELRKMDFDVFVGWNSHCLHSLKAAKKKGAVTIVERGSSHPLYQRKVLLEEYRRQGLKSPFKGRFDRMLLKRSLDEFKVCDYVSIPSSFVEDSFVSQGYNRKKLIKVPYGVELGNFRRVRKKDRTFRVVWCGTLCIRKGIHYLLQAFYELNLKNSELMLIGFVDDDIRPYLKKYRRDNIKAIGPRPQNKLYKYYSQGSVFVHPSVEEGLSMVQLEAMACGLPVIATTNTGASEIITEGKEGFIIPIRDVEAIKGKLRYFYKEKTALKAMSGNAIKKSREFTWDRYGEELEKKYGCMFKK